jgi:colanic acid/amylovoran biosynthesis glycosyltransferase
MTTVLHAFASYLPITENWAFRMVKWQQNTKRLVASHRFLENGFYLEDVQFLRSPIDPCRWPSMQATRSLARAATALNAFLYLPYLRLRLSRTPIDVLHSHFAHVGWKYRNLARSMGVSHVVSFYGWDYERLAETAPVWKRRLPKLFDQADMFLCEGPFGADLLIKQGCPAHKVRISKLGVETSSIPFFARTRVPGRMRLLQLASFREKKGHIDTVRAFASAVRTHPDMHLTLAGASPGAIFDELKTEVENNGLSSHVTFIGSVNPDSIYELMRENDVFIHPSRYASDRDCEGGAPIVLLDAQATGMPVISTVHCDIPQEVVHGRTGILCPERDIEAIADAIRFFCDTSADTYSSFAEAARRHVIDNFEARICASHVEHLYRELAR